MMGFWPKFYFSVEKSIAGAKGCLYLRSLNPAGRWSRLPSLLRPWHCIGVLFLLCLVLAFINKITPRFAGHRSCNVRCVLKRTMKQYSSYVAIREALINRHRIWMRHVANTATAYSYNYNHSMNLILFSSAMHIYLPRRQ